MAEIRAEIRLVTKDLRDDIPATLRILTDDPDGFANGQRNLTAPNGTRIEIDELNLPPEIRHRVMYASDNIPAIISR